MRGWEYIHTQDPGVYVSRSTCATGTRPDSPFVFVIFGSVVFLASGDSLVLTACLRLTGPCLQGYGQMLHFGKSWGRWAIAHPSCNQQINSSADLSAMSDYQAQIKLPGMHGLTSSSLLLPDGRKMFSQYALTSDLNGTT